MIYKAMAFSGILLAGGLAAVIFGRGKTETSRQYVSIEGKVESAKRVDDCYLVDLIQTEVKFSGNYLDYSESPQLKLCGPRYNNFEEIAKSSKRIKIGAMENCDVKGKGIEAVYSSCHIAETFSAEPLN